MSEDNSVFNDVYGSEVFNTLEGTSPLADLVPKLILKPHWGTKTFGNYVYPECNCIEEDFDECHCEGYWEEGSVTIDWFFIPDRPSYRTMTNKEIGDLK